MLWNTILQEADLQSDLESSSEWEEGGGSVAVVERLSKDTVYQAYLKMRQRYHKYKGRYALWLFVCWLVLCFRFVAWCQLPAFSTMPVIVASFVLLLFLIVFSSVVSSAIFTFAVFHSHAVRNNKM